MGKFLWRGDPTVLHEVGALMSLDVVRGEWWRLLTCCFLHFGLVHLCLNMWAPLRARVAGIDLGGRVSSFFCCPELAESLLFFSLQSAERRRAGRRFGAIWGLMISVAMWVFLNRSHLPSEELMRRLPPFAFVIMINVGVSFMPDVSASAFWRRGCRVYPGDAPAHSAPRRRRAGPSRPS